MELEEKFNSRYESIANGIEYCKQEAIKEIENEKLSHLEITLHELRNHIQQRELLKEIKGSLE